jgi:CheY-like chemotaxis protein
MREVLMPLDFVVLTAAGGMECVTLIEGIKPDLFLIDISMPGMNGWQLVTRLRDHGQTAPVIMLSANIGDGTAADTHTGHNDTLAKPFDIRQLQDKLAVHLTLEWIYSDTVQPAPKAKPKRTMTNPGAAHVEELIRLGEIGYVRGIEAKLADLARLEENQPFTDAVKTYVQAFDLAGYADFLQNINKQGRPAGE